MPEAMALIVPAGEMGATAEVSEDQLVLAVTSVEVRSL